MTHMLHENSNTFKTFDGCQHYDSIPKSLTELHVPISQLIDVWPISFVAQFPQF